MSFGSASHAKDAAPERRSREGGPTHSWQARITTAGTDDSQKLLHLGHAQRIFIAPPGIAIAAPPDVPDDRIQVATIAIATPLVGIRSRRIPDLWGARGVAEVIDFVAGLLARRR